MQKLSNTLKYVSIHSRKKSKYYKKVFILGWGEKADGSIKRKQRQIQRINRDVHEACDLNVHWRDGNAGWRKHQICLERWGDFNLPHINTWNKHKCHISIMFFHRLSPLLLQWFNGTWQKNQRHQHRCSQYSSAWKRSLIGFFSCGFSAKVGSNLH